MDSIQSTNSTNQEVDNELFIEISELGNVEECSDNYFLKIYFMNKSIPEIQNDLTQLCGCSILYFNFSWSLKLPSMLSEEDFIDITSNHFIVVLERIPQEKNVDIREIVGYFKLNITSWLKPETDKIHEQVETIKFGNNFCATNMKTWPNAAYIKYKIIPSKNLLQEYQSEDFQKFSITFSCILNPSDIFGKTEKFGMVLYLPLSNNTFKKIEIKNGRIYSFGVMLENEYYIDWAVSNFKGNIKFSKVKINKSYEKCEFKIPMNCLLKDKVLMTDDVVSFQNIFQCMLPRKLIRQIVDNKSLNLDVFVVPRLSSKLGDMQEFIGIVELSYFQAFNIKQGRLIVPLIKNSESTEGVQSDENSEVQTDTLNPKKDFIFNENGFSTCVVIEVELESPLFKRREDKLIILENKSETSKLLEEKVETSLVSKFKNTLIKQFYAIQKKGKEDVNANKQLLENAIGLLSEKFNFNLHSKEETQDLFESNLIYLVNKCYESDTKKIEKFQSREFRLQSALECFELGLLEESRDFYVMNVQDDAINNSKSYLDYAVHSLLTNDIPMAKVCCHEVLSQNPTEYSANFFLGYISFVEKDFKRSEKCFINLTELYPTCIESWIALLIVYISDENLYKLKSIEKNLEQLEHNSSYQHCLHTQPETLWLHRRYNDQKLNAILGFIRCGCFQLAEIGLGIIIHKYGCDSFEYLFYTALILYYRKDYSGALKKMANIKILLRETDTRILRTHCLLGMNSLTAIYELKRITVKTNECYRRLIHVIYLKVGQYYMNESKFRTAKYFFKKCCFTCETYAGFQLLGTVSLKNNDLNLAELCFKIVNKVNPFDKMNWINLRTVFMRQNRNAQYDICTKLSEL